jgi:hypothetical protein
MAWKKVYGPSSSFKIREKSQQMWATISIHMRPFVKKGRTQAITACSCWRISVRRKKQSYHTRNLRSSSHNLDPRCVGGDPRLLKSLFSLLNLIEKTFLQVLESPAQESLLKVPF